MKLEYDNLVFTHNNIPYILFRKVAVEDVYYCTSLASNNSTIDGGYVTKEHLDLNIKTGIWIVQFNMVDVCKEIEWQ
jgi:hypothetical protein